MTLVLFPFSWEHESTVQLTDVSANEPFAVARSRRSRKYFLKYVTSPRSDDEIRPRCAWPRPHRDDSWRLRLVQLQSRIMLSSQPLTDPPHVRQRQPYDQSVYTAHRHRDARPPAEPDARRRPEPIGHTDDRSAVSSTSCMLLESPTSRLPDS